MKSLDERAVYSTVIDTLNHYVPLDMRERIQFDTGMSLPEFASKITEEFCQSAHEEDFSSYLTKASLRGQAYGGMLPEHVIEKVVNTHLTNEAFNSNPQLTEKEKQMSNNYGPPDYHAMEKKAITGPAMSASSDEVQRALETLARQGYNHGLPEPAVLQQNNAFMEAFKHVGTTIGGQIKGAVTAEVSARINKALIGYARQAFPQLPQGPMADTMLGFAIPSILLLIAHSVREAGPESIGISRQITDGVETTAKAALAGVSRDAVSSAVNQAVPMLTMVAAMSAGNIPDQLADGTE